MVIPTSSSGLPMAKALALLLCCGIRLATLGVVTLNLYFNRAEEAVAAGRGESLEAAPKAGRCRIKPLVA
ncbi:hypothetical protein QU481_03530 [Crenobacter sp. SG2303]|uniref:Uncharacterized protein n=1 Tax=Crenobacter oryzisoli TaxID=3056844 RepID=A0ABT7XJK1_9NEIS|nr:hypothetical protein [Crenobacter sp. SG2303]MDN0073964.1 hypothetical protein [Crenobacter sp. SG2303]